MTNKLALIVSSLIHCKKVKLVMKLTTMLILFGTTQVFAASYMQDNRTRSLNNLNPEDLLVSVTMQISSPGQSVEKMIADYKADDQQKTVKGLITDSNGQPMPGVNILEKGTIN